MNLLFLSEIFYPHGSGGELATYLWANLLASSGFNVRVVTNRFPAERDRSISGNLEIYRLQIFNSQIDKYSLMLRLDILLSSLVRRLMSWADVVYVTRFWYSAIPIAKAFGKPVITQVHSYTPICSVSSIYDLSRAEICSSRGSCHPRCIIAHEHAHGRSLRETLGSTLLGMAVWRHFRKLIQLSDVVVCASKAQKRILTEHMPSLQRNCKVVYYPMPELPVTEIQGRDVGYFGGPSPLKGYDILQSALRRANCKITLHATGFRRSGLTRFPNDSRIVFYERLSYLSPDYEQLYSKIQTVVVPSTWAEPFGFVVSEAILRGRLVIASRTGGIPEQLDDSPGVFLFEPGDEKQLARLLEHVNGLDRQTVRHLASRDRRLFVRKFDNKQSLAQFVSLIEATAERG